MTKQDPAPPRLLLRPRDAAKALEISERKLWSLTDPRGPIRYVRVGRAVRYVVEDLREFIDRQKGDERC